MSSQISIPLIETNAVHETDVGTTEQCNNKMMTISDAVMELENRGFSCDISLDGSRAVGTLSSWRWLLLSKIDVVSFVQEVSETAKLTVETVEAELKRAKLHVDDRTLGVSCPPRGCMRGCMVIVVFLARGEDEIDPQVLSRIVSEPDKEFCVLTILAAQDGRGRSHYFEKKTPLWGKALWPEGRYWAGLLTGRPVDSTLPAFGGGIFYKILFSFSIVSFLAVMVFDLVFMPKNFSFLLLFYVMLVAIQHWKNIRARKAKNLQKNSGEIQWCEQ